MVTILAVERGSYLLDGGIFNSDLWKLQLAGLFHHPTHCLKQQKSYSAAKRPNWLDSLHLFLCVLHVLISFLGMVFFSLL